VTFMGVSAHAAAAPEEGRNALLAACTATQNLHAISRSGKGDTRISVGRLEGGDARNIVPATAHLLMETRGETTQLEAYMSTEAERILRAAADMWGCTCHIEVVGGACGGASSPELARLVAETASAMGCYQTIREQERFGATEDFACLMTRVQECGGSATYLQVGAKRSAGHHNDAFDFDEACLPRTLELLARFVCRVKAKNL
ncbi:MAG: peptidase dimerization domain-containing protein, partial [Bilophila sp.]